MKEWENLYLWIYLWTCFICPLFECLCINITNYEFVIWYQYVLTLDSCWQWWCIEWLKLSCKHKLIMIIMNSCNDDVFYLEKLTQFKDIVNHYVKSWIFVCDIISLLPLEVLCLIWSSDFEREFAFGVLKLNRLLKIYRVCLCWYVLRVLLFRLLIWYNHSFVQNNQLNMALGSAYVLTFVSLIIFFVPNVFWFCYLNISSVLQLGWFYAF